MKSPRLFSFVLMLLVLTFDACESQNCGYPLKTITVSQSGKANFKTIQSAIDSVPAGNSQWIHIQISPGVYKEQIGIPMNKPCIYLEGAGRKSTSIEWPAKVNATFLTKANNTAAKGLTFKNTLNHGNIFVTEAYSGRIQADKCAFFDCAFIGLPGSLNDDYGRHYYHNCYIQGGTDFICGNGQSIFEASTIYFSMGKYVPIEDGVITAQERGAPNDPSGFVFKNCMIEGKGGKVQLGRAMNAYARVIIADSFLSDVVKPEGWDPRNYAGHESTITFVEERNRGPGSNNSTRVKWMKHLSGPALDQFLNISFIDTEGWISKLPTKIFI